MGALAALLQVLFPEVDELDEALELELDALELDELELLDETLELLELLTELELLELLIELDEELELIELLEETELPLLPPPPHPANVTEPTTAKRRLADAFKVRLPDVFMQGRPLVDICRKRFQTAPVTVVFFGLKVQGRMRRAAMSADRRINA